MKQRLLLWGGLGALLVGAACFSWFVLQQPVPFRYDQEVQVVAYIRGHFFGLEVADTPEERAKGLSGRDHIGPRQGMLFVFESPGRPCFWMKDTLVPLDMLWFDQNFKLVHQQHRVAPDTYPQTFCPPADAKYVVELRGGTAQALGVELGATLKLK